ncbi:putative uncharacterized protein [Eubacterium sp. CAG:603]|jgi:Phage-related protein|nr:putative uncharacterized protein [Eubacterium sp. CAG:603]
MGIIIFNGVSSKEFDIQVEHPPGYEYPQKDYDVTHIPGRNGDVYVDKGSYQNVTRSYDIAIGSEKRNFAEMANCISEWLNSASGYARLEDNYEAEYYRLATYASGGTITNILEHAGRVTVSFNCKPQRFLKSGDNRILITKTCKLRNPTNFKSLPIIKVYGSDEGILRIGDYVITLSKIDSYVVVDSELQDIYKDAINCNSTATLSNGFPKLIKGENEVSFSGGITKVEVIPKWWTL